MTSKEATTAQYVEGTERYGTCLRLLALVEQTSNWHATRSGWLELPYLLRRSRLALDASHTTPFPRMHVGGQKRQRARPKLASQTCLLPLLRLDRPRLVQRPILLAKAEACLLAQAAPWCLGRRASSNTSVPLPKVYISRLRPGGPCSSVGSPLEEIDTDRASSTFDRLSATSVNMAHEAATTHSTGMRINDTICFDLLSD